MLNKPFKTKCDFCKYKTASGCMTMPNSAYCREAADEYYQYLKSRNATQQLQQKSLRPWDRR